MRKRSNNSDGQEGVGRCAARRAGELLGQAGAAPEAAAAELERPAHRVRAAAHLRDLQVHRRLSLKLTNMLHSSTSHRQTAAAPGVGHQTAAVHLLDM
jgi:hypothetical protein